MMTLVEGIADRLLDAASRVFPDMPRRSPKAKEALLRRIWSERGLSGSVTVKTSGDIEIVDEDEATADVVRVAVRRLRI